MPTCCTDMDFERFMWCDASKMILIPRHPVARQPRDSLPWKSWFCLGAANSRRKRRPIAAQATQLHAGRINQPNAIADLPPIAGLQLRHQGREQSREDLHRTRSIGSRERRSRYGAAAKMVKLAGAALQVRFNLAQAR